VGVVLFVVGTGKKLGCRTNKLYQLRNQMAAQKKTVAHSYSQD